LDEDGSAERSVLPLDAVARQRSDGSGEWVGSAGNGLPGHAAAGPLADLHWTSGQMFCAQPWLDGCWHPAGSP